MIATRMDADRKQLTTRQRVIVAIHQWRADDANKGDTLTAEKIGAKINMAPSTVYDARGPLEKEGLIEPNDTGKHDGWHLTETGRIAAARLANGD